MAELQGSTSTSSSGESADAQSLTLSEAHGGSGLSFTAKANASEKVQELHDLMESLREKFAELNVPQRKNLVGQERINEAEEYFVDTLIDEYSELDSLLEERINQ